MESDNKISEWNEANLKMKRLHDAQEKINFCKCDPQGFTEGKFNYEWWIKNINVLYGEGNAKYLAGEKKTAERLKKVVETKIEISPPHAKVVYDFMGGSQRGWVVNENNLKELIKLIEAYEDVVKEYNDKHGLSTKNKGYSGMF